MPRRSKPSDAPHGPRDRRAQPAKPSEAATISVRIIGGSLRRRRLECVGDPRTRPMKDRVREAVFNLLGDVTGTIAVDLFAGTGALGFEAISRGARAAVFFEQHFPTADRIRRNATALGVTDACHVAAADTLVWFSRQVRLPDLPGEGPWLVFCSPPYALYVDRRDELLEMLGRLWETAPRESAFVVEADDRFDFGLLPADGWDIRDYAPARVALAWKRT